MDTQRTTSAMEESDLENMSMSIEYCMPEDLELLGIGGAAIVFAVDTHIVLKAIPVIKKPPSGASESEHWTYASSTLSYADISANERRILGLLQDSPHRNVVEVVDISHDEGLYLRRYNELPQTSSPAERLVWYGDIFQGLVHVHSLGLAHADVRSQNVLLDDSGRAVLCDFSMSAHIGAPEHRAVDPSFSRSGFSDTLSDCTDRFSMACLIAEMECDQCPNISRGPRGAIEIEDLTIESYPLESVMRRAWCKEFDSTLEMLREIYSITGVFSQDAPIDKRPSLDFLRQQLEAWRCDRIRERGAIYLEIPTAHDLDILRSIVDEDED